MAAVIDRGRLMEKALALQIMDVIQAAETQVNILESLSLKIADDDERKAFRRHLAEIPIWILTGRWRMNVLTNRSSVELSIPGVRLLNTRRSRVCLLG